MSAAFYGGDARRLPTIRGSLLKTIDHRRGAQKQWHAIEDFNSSSPINYGRAQRTAAQPHQRIIEYKERATAHTGALDLIEADNGSNAKPCCRMPVGKIHCDQIVQLAILDGRDDERGVRGLGADRQPVGGLAIGNHMAESPSRPAYICQAKSGQHGRKVRMHPSPIGLGKLAQDAREAGGKFQGADFPKGLQLGIGPR